MKMISKVLLTAAAIAALAAPAMAADKLIVKDAAGTSNVFSVDDAGMVLGKKLGMGTTSPQAPLHLNLPSTLGVTPNVGTALYSVSSGFVMSTQDNTPALDLTAADNTTPATPGYRGAIRGVRSRGLLTAPTAVKLDDQIFSLLAGAYSGRVVNNAADISFIADADATDGGTQPTTATPIRISFKTRPVGWTWYERLVIKADGKIKVDPTAMPVYADNAAATTGGLPAGSLYRTSTGVLMMRY